MGEDQSATNADRLGRVEDEVSRLRERLAEMRGSVQRQTEVDTQQDHETRMRNLEVDMANNKQVVGAVKWLTMTLFSTAFLVALTALSEVVL